MIKVRLAHPDDAAAIEGLIALYVPDGTLLPRTAAFIAERHEDFLVAVEDRRVVGCVHLDEYAPSLAEIRSLAVAPSAQGRGVGTALVREAERLSRKRGHATIFAVSNDEAYFGKLGYLRREIRELDRERSEVSRYKGVYAKDVPLP